MTANGYEISFFFFFLILIFFFFEISFFDNENVVEVDSNDGCTVWNRLKTTTLNTSEERFL